jgi:chromosomal replication initiation ATPase DnaA
MLSTDRRFQILHTAAAMFHVHPTMLIGRDRHQTVSLARHVAAYLFRCDGLSYPEIGREMGRDHTSAMSSVKRIIAILTMNEPDEIAARIRRGAIDLGHERICLDPVP